MLVNIRCGVIASGMSFFWLAPLAAAQDRQALWRVVQTCVADLKLTGAPFPCLEVNLAGGETKGYAVLHPPFGAPDLILSPTRRVTGVEDPWLQSPNAPNYFDAALRARSFLKGPDGRPPELGDVALAVNSAAGRSQDQLHIHIGCLTLAVKRAVTAFASKLPFGKWTRLGGGAPGSLPWGFRIGRAELESVEPFRLAAAGPADSARNRARLMIAVAGVRIANDDDLIILASLGASLGPASAEDIVDQACSTGSGLSGAN